MGMGITIHTDIQGAADVAKFLNEIGHTRARRALLRGMKKGAVPVLAAIVDRVPTADTGKIYNKRWHERGTLKRSLQIATKRGRVGTDEASVRVGPDWTLGFYAHFVEYGTVHSAANSFMRDGQAASQDKAVDEAGIVMGRATKRWNMRKARAAA